MVQKHDALQIALSLRFDPIKLEHRIFFCQCLVANKTYSFETGLVQELSSK